LFVIARILIYICRSCRDGHPLSYVGEKKGGKDSPLGDEIKYSSKKPTKSENCVFNLSASFV